MTGSTGHFCFMPFLVLKLPIATASFFAVFSLIAF
jgi:hypothetical protein